MTYGVGACLGPMVAGLLMSAAGPSMYYVFVSVCALILVWQVRPARVTGAHQVDEAPVRSEEHTSELQSLMRISYAVFCLQKKNIQTSTQNTKRTHIIHTT